VIGDQSLDVREIESDPDSTYSLHVSLDPRFHGIERIAVHRDHSSQNVPVYESQEGLSELPVSIIPIVPIDQKDTSCIELTWRRHIGPASDGSVSLLRGFALPHDKVYNDGHDWLVVNAGFVRSQDHCCVERVAGFFSWSRIYEGRQDFNLIFDSKLTQASLQDAINKIEKFPPVGILVGQSQSRKPRNAIDRRSNLSESVLQKLWIWRTNHELFPLLKEALQILLVVAQRRDFVGMRGDVAAQ
jgi:hypothetical protein